MQISYFLTKLRKKSIQLRTSLTTASGSELMTASAYTVIRFVSISAKFSIFTVVGLDRTLVEAKIAIFESPSAYFSFRTGITFRLTTVQMPYLALIENKRITVYVNQISFVWIVSCTL
jgi:hypothetical protein